MTILSTPMHAAPAAVPPRESRPPEPRRLTLPAAIALHLVPGALIAAAYFALLPLTRRLLLPSVAALALTGLLVIPPVELGVLMMYRRRGRHAFSHEPVVPWRTRLPLRRLVGWSATIMLAAAIAFAASGGQSESVRRGAFAWWPASWKVELGAGGGFSRPSLIVAALLVIAGSVIVAPIVEEIYFRGFLLPRMPANIGRAAPFVHAALFGLYHLWTPWLFPTRALAILPLVYAVTRTKDLRVAIVAHCALNAVDAVVIIAYVVGR